MSFRAVIAITAALTFGGPAQAQESAARASAQGIIKRIAAKEYSQLWDSLVSDWFKQRITKAAFIANMTMSRSPIGPLTQSSILQASHLDIDQTTGYKGDIYTFMFENIYSNAKFYEQIVVIREPDGTYRLSGLQGAPAP
jgi:hypothetical protein